MKLCKDCIHLIERYPINVSAPGGVYVCAKFTTVNIEPVNGDRELSHVLPASYCREDETKCGRDAKYFEEKPTLLKRIKSALNRF